MSDRGLRPQSIQRFASAWAISLAVAALSYLETLLLQSNVPTPGAWLPNALVTAQVIALLLRQPKWSAPAVTGALVANVIANFQAGAEFGQAGLLGAANCLQIGVVCGGMRILGARNPSMERLADLTKFYFVGGIVAPLLAGCVSGLTATHSLSSAPAEIVSRAFCIGVVFTVVIPTILIASDGLSGRSFPVRPRLTEWTLILSGAAIMTALVFAYGSMPVLFGGMPLILLAAFRLGTLGAVVASTIVAAVGTVAAIRGVGSILVAADLSYKLTVLAGFIAVSFAISLPVAASLRRRDEIARGLKESEDLNRSILNNMREVIFKVDADGRWVFLNSAWKDLTGCSDTESLGTFMTELVDPGDLARLQSEFGRIAAGALQECTLPMRMWDLAGTSKHIEMNLRRLYTSDGQAAGAIGNIRDITEQVRQRQFHLESERRFQKLAELAPAGIFRTDCSGKCNYVNASWLRKTGLTGGEWEGEGWLRALHPEDCNRIALAWQSAVETQAEFRGEFRWLRPDGSTCWVDVLAAPEFADDGTVSGFIGVNLDITERHLFEAELLKRDTQLTLLADNATDAVFRIALDGRCLYASPSSLGVLGVYPGRLIGKPVARHVRPADRAAIAELFERLLTGYDERGVVAFRAGRGNHALWLEANCGVVRSPKTGLLEEIIASVRDVSATKALEEDLRTARERAETAAAAKSAFLANISHEIRTPMNGVLGFTELLLAGKLSRSQRRYVELIADSGSAMMHLLNDVLDISKIESGQVRLSEESVDIRHIVNKCMQLFQPSAAGKEVRLDVVVDFRLPPYISGDALRLRQIVLNLVGNAVKFTSSGTITVQVTVESSGSDAILCLAVSDTGIGIPSDKLEIIFDKFAQGEESIDRRFGGTGLGLSITHELVQLMGGTIEVRSVYGAGSTFTVRMPLVPIDRAVGPTGSQADYTIEASPIAVSSPRILIAEDHEINQALMLAMVRQIGADPIIAGNGAEAMAMVTEAAKHGRPFKLVLMDIQMPELDGLMATRELRRLGFSSDDLPIVALTANAFAEDLAACLDSGMQGHLCKPVHLNQIRSVVTKFTQQGLAREGFQSRPIATEIEKLRGDYATRKQTALRAVSELVRRGNATDASVADVLDALHKLAGTAGFFGEGVLGEAAGALEHAIRGSHPAQRLRAIHSAWPDLKRAAG